MFISSEVSQLLTIILLLMLAIVVCWLYLVNKLKVIVEDFMRQPIAVDKKTLEVLKILAGSFHNASRQIEELRISSPTNREEKFISN